jgi:hypothetical protein
MKWYGYASEKFGRCCLTELAFALRGEGIMDEEVQLQSQYSPKNHIK